MSIRKDHTEGETAVGVFDGAVEGVTEGLDDGVLEGLAEGFDEGALEGIFVGDFVGGGGLETVTRATAGFTDRFIDTTETTRL